MAKRERILKRYRVTNHPDFNELRITLSYDIGGMNYFTSREDQRGLRLDATPLMVSGDKGGYRTVSYRGFSGVKMFIHPMKRFSQKVLDTFNVTEDQFNRVKDHVVNQHGLELEEVEECK